MDTTKIKVGDEVVVRIKVEHVAANGKLYSYSLSPGGHSTTRTLVDPNDVIEHIPAPLEVQVGDVFRGVEDGPRFTVIYIEGDHVAYRYVPIYDHSTPFRVQTASLDIVRGYLLDFGNFRDK